MINSTLSIQAYSVLQNLCDHPKIGRFIDASLGIPQVFCGAGPVHLIILGQDPTVDNPKARRGVSTVLNLDKSGNLKTYLRQICGYMDIDLNNQVYATNLYKNFFTIKPTANKEIDIFQECLPYWLPVLISELEQFPAVTVLTLGEPLLSMLATGQASKKVRDYWGFTSHWKTGSELPFTYLKAEANLLKRVVFPYPHQPSWQRKKFYSDRLERYSIFARLILKELPEGK